MEADNGNKDLHNTKQVKPLQNLVSYLKKQGIEATIVKKPASNFKLTF